MSDHLVKFTQAAQWLVPEGSEPRTLTGPLDLDLDFHSYLVVLFFLNLCVSLLHNVALVSANVYTNVPFVYSKGNHIQVYPLFIRLFSSVGH